MGKYKFLLFDLDDTLLDFSAAEDFALHRLFEEEGLILTKEIEETYRQINSSLWRKFEEGAITRDEVTSTRFAKLFSLYGKQVDGKLFDDKYRNHLAECKVFIDGAWELINDFATKYQLYIVTNGVSATQYKRLDITGLAPLFHKVFVSEDTGFQKPMLGFFDYVFDRIPNFKKEEALIIGDSFSADIIGGINAGIDTCWLNRFHKVNETDQKPTYEIQHLQQLYTILK